MYVVLVYLPFVVYVLPSVDGAKGVATLASAQMQQWTLTFSAYNYSVEYKPGACHGNADRLSRLPFPETPSEIPVLVKYPFHGYAHLSFCLSHSLLVGSDI